MRLTRIGYWLDTEGEWPDPRAFADPDWDPEEREMVIDYVGRGFVARAYLGMSTCRLCGQSNGSHELTDGVFVWPEGLGHYLESHSVRLPERFVVHVQRMVDAFEMAPVDEDWWRNAERLGR